MSEKVQKPTFVINNAIELTNQDTEGDTRQRLDLDSMQYGQRKAPAEDF
jgi:hypothetical protein